MKTNCINWIQFLMKHVFIFFCFSCKKDGQVPVLTTSEVTSIYANMASCGGEVISNGGTTNLPKGICWNTEPSPTIKNNKTVDYSSSDIFIGSLTDLMPNTTYYVRAYATNNDGTGYGNEVQFTTKHGVTDFEGNVYNIVTIGTQRWLRENLKVTRYNDGTPITYINFDSINREAAYCWYMNTEEYKNIYGALYNWFAVNTGKLCPSGWHIATEEDWKTLINYAGGSNIAGNKLKEVGTSHWIYDSGSTNEFDFTALPGGIFWFQFEGLGNGGIWWTATEFNENGALFKSMRQYDGVIRGIDAAFDKREFYSFVV